VTGLVFGTGIMGDTPLNQFIQLTRHRSASMILDFVQFSKSKKNDLCCECIDAAGKQRYFVLSSPK
jgi:hypothetical protein